LIQRQRATNIQLSGRVAYLRACQKYWPEFERDLWKACKADREQRAAELGKWLERYTHSEPWLQEMQEATVAWWDHQVESGFGPLMSDVSYENRGFVYPRTPPPFDPKFADPQPILDLEIVDGRPRLRQETILAFRTRMNKTFKAQLDAFVSPINAVATQQDSDLVRKAKIAVLMQKGMTLGEVARSAYGATGRKTKDLTKQENRRFCAAIGLIPRPSRTRKGSKSST
jgi:hypothetical protein